MPEKIFSGRDLWIALVSVLVGAVLSFVSMIGWDSFKERKERKSIVTMLQMELSDIHATITANIKILQDQQKNLEKGGETFSRLHTIETTAWESAKLRNGLFIEDTRDLLKMVFLYTTINAVNEDMRFRENYWMQKRDAPLYTKKY